MLLKYHSFLYENHNSVGTADIKLFLFPGAKSYWIQAAGNTKVHARERG
jgi:hypothetical protein